MNVIVLYLLLLKATLTSFSGLGSLPIIHADLVEKHRVLTEHQLNTAVAAGRSGPGPVGLFTVSVGFAVAGIPGAIAGWLAMVTPAFLILPLLRYASGRANDPRVKRMIRAILLASAGLLVSSAIPLGKEAFSGPLTLIIAMASLGLTLFTRIDTALIILAAALAGLLKVIN